MPIATEENTKQYAIGAGQTQFQFPYMLFAPSTDLTVEVRQINTDVVTTLVYGTDYTVTAIDQDFSNGCTVTTTIAWGVLYEITIDRSVAFIQPIDFERGGQIDPESMDRSHDRATILTQQAKAMLSRAMLAPITDTLGLDLALPSLESRKDMYLFFDEDGKPTAIASEVPAAQVSSLWAGVIDDLSMATSRNTIDVYAKADVYQKSETYTKSEIQGLLLPVGIVLPYNGSGIDSPGTRSTKLGDEVGDTIDPPYGNWYVCNGNASTPNLIDKFVRAGTASGNTGGSDDAILKSHQHDADGAHRHFLFQYIGNATHMTSGSTYAACIQGQQAGDMAYFICHNNANAQSGRTNSEGSHQHPAEGETATGKNIPAYYSLIFIIRMA